MRLSVPFAFTLAGLAPPMANGQEVAEESDEEKAAITQKMLAASLPEFDSIPWGATVPELERTWGAPLGFDEDQGFVLFPGRAVEVSTGIAAFVDPDYGLFKIVYAFVGSVEDATVIYFLWANKFTSQFAPALDCKRPVNVCDEAHEGLVWIDEDRGEVRVILAPLNSDDPAVESWAATLTYHRLRTGHSPCRKAALSADLLERRAQRGSENEEANE